MTSLTEVYEGRVRWVASARRLYLGVALFAVGVAMVVAGILVATTGVRSMAGLGLFEARQLAGVLAGLGTPAALFGVFTVLPTNRRLRATALIGASVSVLGVTLFWHAYPYRWLADGAVLGVVTMAVYFFGAITTFVSVFVAVATFQRRSDPGGNATMEVTREGTVRIVEERRSLPGFTGIGLFGDEPEGDVETQTGRTTDDQPSADAPVDEDGGDEPLFGQPSTPDLDATPTADGGSAAATADGDAELPDDDAEFLDAAASRGRPDAYCGNCTHFSYVRTGGQMVPYCELQAELMEDMDACEEWQPNS